MPKYCINFKDSYFLGHLHIGLFAFLMKYILTNTENIIIVSHFVNYNSKRGLRLRRTIYKEVAFSVTVHSPYRMGLKLSQYNTRSTRIRVSRELIEYLNLDILLP